MADELKPGAKAKAKKAAAKPEMKADQPGTSGEMVYKTPKDQFVRTLKGLEETAQDCAKATTTNASEWKGAKSAGCHNGALKDIMKLDKLTEEGRADYMRAFNGYAQHFHDIGKWTEQLDLVDECEKSVDREDLAMGQGFRAGKEGGNLQDNPFPENDIFNDTWADGWHQGQAVIMAGSKVTNKDAGKKAVN